jgi:hypothetical protein
VAAIAMATNPFAEPAARRSAGLGHVTD